MTKSELRSLYKSKRAALSEDEVDQLSIDIANQLLRMDIWNHSFYHLFLSIASKKEIQTDFILNILSGKDKNIVISKSDFKSGTMTNFLLTDNTVIKVNAYGIPEPEDGIEIANDKLNVIFIPLLAFDEKGQRIGYGKGFYDRFLVNCNPSAIKIGLSFFEAESQFEDMHEADIPLDYCVTPKNIYTFSN
ncbi:5-formyltetrahydrofolate cyclo-ligase [Mangrovimonas sp. YM274]|uniref:5-formyltetrahydrofolate cyclo-ligase n=1 Tax=Mangrovimonas sp. YM274 TaxID=3070660 RepID=UPI0027DBF999|nr:5-formyltetrahydrofolate cyclo-ligase [Mangrovimonas sp. YM274]WMI69254.1 5-formyltetrahydrofolate cyclo-ligase [Mangrovimonas sp. YM274]